MLLNTKKPEIKEGDVIAVKIVTGEEFVGKLEAKTDDEFVIGKPLGIGVSAEGQPGISQMPIILGGGDQELFTVCRANIMIYTPAAKVFKDAWEQATSSIIQPNTSIIT